MNDSHPRARRQQRLLVIDDDPSLSLIARELFAKEPIEVLSAESGSAGLELVRNRRPDVVLLDHFLPDASGTELFARIREFDARVPVIWVTASGASETAIEATRAGAFDYLTKPIDLARLVQQVRHAISSRQLMLAPVEVDDTSAVSPKADSLIGRSARMQDVYKAIGRLAADDVPVLIVGESGTGKQLVARTLYEHGTRSSNPFIHVRCRDYSPAQLATRLFGEVFPNEPSRLGDVDHAGAGGTLLLEDLSAIDLATQSKLLQLLQQRQFQRVGSEETCSATVGLIISSQDDPEMLLRNQRLHSDFYFAFSPFTIRMPALRHRTEDISLLVEHFIRHYANVHKSFGPEVMRVSPEALALIQSYHWPGNVAELQSVLRRAMMETKGTVLASDYLRSVLRSDGRNEQCEEPTLAEVSGEAVTDWQSFVRKRISEQSTCLYDEAIGEMESHVLRELLSYTRGNQSHAAHILGITRTSLRRRIQSRGISIASPNASEAARS